MSLIHTIVYAGPTIKEKVIQSYLPNACVHHPIQCGDVLKAIRIGVKRLIIIDGYFEHRASVWHKEILLAIDSGIEVIGAGSMGALRAVECNPYGMLGFGQIVDWYQSGYIDGDDEVAVHHYPAEAQFEPCSEALVSFRYNLKTAVDHRIITLSQCEEWIEVLKQTHYPQRNKEHLFHIARLSKESLTDVQKEWLVQHWLDLKKLDAIEALKYARENEPKSRAFARLNQNLLLRLQMREMNCQSFNINYLWLPEIEKKTYQWCHQNHQANRLSYELAKFCHTVYHFFDDINSVSETRCRLFDDLVQEVTDPEFKQVIFYLNRALDNNIITLKRVKFYYPYIRLLFFKPYDTLLPQTRRALLLYTCFWELFNQLANKEQLYASEEKIGQYAHQWMQRLGQVNLGGLRFFLAKYGLSETEFLQICYQGARNYYLFDKFLGGGFLKRETAALKNWVWPLIEILS